ncbi:MAG: 50S ribosomal protein L11 methyltransferase [Sphingomonadaceae bacterium]|nr:50S ribosomal protein L11 methyltransferase [Sphingomonadaceae bacterium]
MSWKLSLPCTRTEAEALKDDIAPLALLEPPPALMTSEIDAAAPDIWRLDAYFESRPDRRTVAAIKRLLPSAAKARAKLEELDDEDWVTLSQQGLEPIREGRFFVHTPMHRDEVPEGAIAFEIDASRAFGTGQHETTAGCLAMLDREKSRGRRFSSIADIGTGTGLLAFAGIALWPHAKAIASDIDPVAIEIAEENVAINGISLGTGPGRLELVTAAGLAHRRLKSRAPYDLVIANILAGPLISLAPAIAHATQPGGTVILAGLMEHQAGAVIAAYRRQRCRLAERLDRGEWTILNLRKRPSPR